MKNNIKIYFISILLFVFILTITFASFASSINMNLTNNENAVTNTAQNESNIENSLTNTSENIISNTTNPSPTKVITTTSNEDFLNAENIMSIILIVIGILIILLAIAILIRCK